VRRFLPLLLAVTFLLGACGGDGGGDGGGADDGTLTSEEAQPTGPAPEGIEGVEAFDIADNTHVEGAIDYPWRPPVAGPHNPVWANCGFYDEPIPDENAVHSLEHGAVWITWLPDDVDEATLGRIRELVDSSDHVLASPYPDQDSPVILTAWNRQLRLDSIDDPRVEQFLETYLLANTAPEPGGPCSGGAG
jgi:Protein of unknown function (DUF3105)